MTDIDAAADFIWRHARLSDRAGRRDVQPARPLAAPRVAQPPDVRAGAIDAHLDALAAGQQDAGGWTFPWPAWAPAVELDWRGYVTIDALIALRANGRLAPRGAAAALGLHGRAGTARTPATQPTGPRPAATLPGA
jgi:hypothetical protein